MVCTAWLPATHLVTLFRMVAMVLLLIQGVPAQAGDERRIAFDFFSMTSPLGWREMSMDERGAYFHQQLAANDLSTGCGLGIGSAFTSTGSLKSDLAAYEYQSRPGNFDAEPPKFFKFQNGWESVSRVYRNRYSPTIHKLVVMSKQGALTQSMTWDLTGSQTCQAAVRASLATLTLLPVKQRIRYDGTQLPIVERAPERDPTPTEMKDSTKFSRDCKAPSTTCIAPRVTRVGSA